MHPADRVKMENEMTAAAVAACLAHAARQCGGVLTGDAAELHKLGSGPLWPRSALELGRVQLPDLARRTGHAGCTVRPVGGLARGVWHVQAAPLPQAAPRPQARPQTAPKPAPRPAAPQIVGRVAASHAILPGAAGLAIPSDEEFARVKAAAEAAQRQRTAQNFAAVAAQRKAIQHANNLRTLTEMRKAR